MCFAKRPKTIKPPAPALPPMQPNKPAEVDRSPKKIATQGDKKRRRGTLRNKQLVITPSGVNQSNSGGVGIYN